MEDPSVYLQASLSASRYVDRHVLQRVLADQCSARGTVQGRSERPPSAWYGPAGHNQSLHRHPDRSSSGLGCKGLKRSASDRPLIVCLRHAPHGGGSEIFVVMILALDDYRKQDQRLRLRRSALLTNMQASIADDRRHTPPPRCTGDRNAQALLSEAYDSDRVRYCTCHARCEHDAWLGGACKRYRGI